MSPRTAQVLEHMLEDVTDIQQYTSGMDFAQFLLDSKTRKAVSMSLLNIGELIRHLPDKMLRRHPEIPWIALIGMRNITAHGYHQLNEAAIWETVTLNMPPLLNAIQQELTSADKAKPDSDETL